jgi:hypothetical protein
MVINHEAEVEGHAVSYFGATDRLSPTISAYAVFSYTPPAVVYFGVASEPFGEPSDGWEAYRLG